jgi:hypothetical protein
LQLLFSVQVTAGAVNVVEQSADCVVQPPLTQVPVRQSAFDAHCAEASDVVA